MSIDQFQLFMKACQLNDKADMRNAVLVSTAGSRYDEKSLKELFTQLE